MAVTNKAAIVVVCGGSGTGKSAWLKRQVRRARRLIVWDPNDEYTGQRVTTRAALLAACRVPVNKPLRVRYVPPAVNQAEFDYWGRVAFAAGQAAVVAEETADVTSAGKAPPGWGLLVRRGRHRGITLYGVTQRPAESDKTIIGNHTLIHCCKLKRAEDRKYMAREMDIDQAELDALKPLEWLETDDQGGKNKGKLRF